MKKTISIFICVCCFLNIYRLHSQIKNMDIPFVEYTYSNNKCNGYKYGSGTIFFIPEDAFSNEDGTNCSQTITIKYRELHTKSDILVSGLNMIYLLNGKRKILESSGMFEIKAECNGKPIRIKKGKRIQVRMKCLTELKNLKTFIYDNKNGFWLNANLPITDFSFRDSSNNKDNANLWGSSSVGNTSVLINGDMEIMDSASYRKNINNIIGNLPDGYIKGLNIYETGIYNYDAIIGDENAVQIIASFKTNTGEDIKEKIYVCYTKKNTLVYYYPDDMKEKFALLQDKGIKIFTVFPDGSTALIKEDSLEKINLKALRGKEYTFILEKQPEKPKDKISLAKALKIQ